MIFRGHYNSGASRITIVRIIAIIKILTIFDKNFLEQVMFD